MPIETEQGGSTTGATSAPWHTRLAALVNNISGATWKGLASTSAWQMANYLIPLLTFPYLARVLGVHGFGMIGIAVAIMAYAVLFTDWGFTLSATQAVARVREDRNAVNAILWATVAAKAVLGSVSLVVAIIGSALFIQDPTLRKVVYISSVTVIGSVLTVDWVLRGLEEMSKFAVSSILGKLATVPLVYLLVHNSTQIAEAAFAMASGSLFTAVITIVMVHKLGVIRRPDLNLRAVRTQLHDGLYVFLSTAVVSIYTNTLTLALGVAAGTREVGLFSGADKLRRPVTSALAPLGMVFYPRMNYLAMSAPHTARSTALRLLFVQTATAFFLSIFLFAAAPFLIRILLGPDFIPATPALRLMALAIIATGISNVLGLMIMLPFGLKREFTMCVIGGAVIGAIAVFPLSVRFGAAGTAATALIAEITVTTMMYVALRYRLPWFRLMGAR